MTQAAEEQVPVAGWQAELKLSFVQAGARTALHERVHRGPLRVQRPFYPEGEGVCHVYLLHPPGGLVTRDHLAIEARLEAGTHALITTPAAGKLYRSADAGHDAVQEQLLQVAAGATLEWLPQETIAFDGARAQLHTRVELAADARLIAWDVLCLGRPAARERFAHGEIRLGWEVSRSGRLVYVERGAYAGGGVVLDAAWGLNGQPVVGTMLCAAPGAERELDAARAALACERDAQSGTVASAAVSGEGHALASVTTLRDLLLARYLGPSAEAARELFARVWSAVRPGLCARPACAPRIWRT